MERWVIFNSQDSSTEPLPDQGKGYQGAGDHKLQVLSPSLHPPFSIPLAPESPEGLVAVPEADGIFRRRVAATSLSTQREGLAMVGASEVSPVPHLETAGLGANRAHCHTGITGSPGPGLACSAQHPPVLDPLLQAFQLSLREVAYSPSSPDSSQFEPAPTGSWVEGGPIRALISLDTSELATAGLTTLFLPRSAKEGWKCLVHPIWSQSDPLLPSSALPGKKLLGLSKDRLSPSSEHLCENSLLLGVSPGLGGTWLLPCSAALPCGASPSSSVGLGLAI